MSMTFSAIVVCIGQLLWKTATEQGIRDIVLGLNYILSLLLGYFVL